jgi:hypothetical protein
VEPLYRAVGEDQEKGAGEHEIHLLHMKIPVFGGHRAAISS